MLGTDGVAPCDGERAVFSTFTSPGFPELVLSPASAKLGVAMSLVAVEGRSESGAAAAIAVGGALVAVLVVAVSLSPGVGVEAFIMLKRSFFPPNMMLPLLEKDRLPKSSHKLSSGMVVVIGVKSDLVGNDAVTPSGAARAAPVLLLALALVGDCCGDDLDFDILGDFSDLLLADSASLLLSPSMIFRFNFFDPPAEDRIPNSFSLNEGWRVGVAAMEDCNG